MSSDLNSLPPPPPRVRHRLTGVPNLPNGDTSSACPPPPKPLYPAHRRRSLPHN